MIDRRQLLAMLTAIPAVCKSKIWASGGAEDKSGFDALPPGAGQSVSAHILQSAALLVRLMPTGALQSIQNLESQETYSFVADSFSIDTNHGVFCSRGLKGEMQAVRDGVISYRFVNPGQYAATLNYRLGASGHYIERWLEIDDVAAPLHLLKIGLSWSYDEKPPLQTIKYDTFWNAPTVTFLRWTAGGLFTGIENPFFEQEVQGPTLSLSYEPSLILDAGESYQSEAQFIGAFQRTGKTVADHYLPTLDRARPDMVRFRNPSGHIPLDWNEVQSMRQFVYDYLSPRLDRFVFLLYMYWYPIEQLWSLPEDTKVGQALVEAKYDQVVNNFSEIGGDLIIFNPLSKYSRPEGRSNACWNVAPDYSTASRILALARQKELEYGFYMGVAAQGDQGNAAALPFAPDEPSWKKIDLAGGTSGENCMACRSYADWWYVVQRNTIAKFNLGLWSWDPGPGNGSFCYSADHGHIPGKGTYKGWREATRLTGRLKSEFPNTILMAFYGRKEYGLWGLKNFDIHESYWEQTILYGATKHADLHDDRINADGARYQSWWNENFRFLPTGMNHALVHRIGENSYDSRLPKAWDHLGWRYSLMSAIASSGNAIACILPEELSDVPEFKMFYAKWLGWARKNIEYVRYNVTFGDQVRPGGVDIHARIKGDHGFIFLCNPGPRPARTEFSLDRTIGLRQEGRYILKELYPAENRFYFDQTHHRGVYGMGDSVSFTVPAYEICLLELSRFEQGTMPLVFGVGGEIRRNGDSVMVEAVKSQPGETAEVILLSGAAPSNPAVAINGKRVLLEERGGYWGSTIQFAGATLPRALDDWRTPYGEKFDFPFHQGADDLTLQTSVFLHGSIREILSHAVPPNLADFDGLLESWRETLPHTFTWARPDRLWWAVPFTDADDVREVTARCNGKELALQWFAPRDRPNGSRVIAYVDITEAVSFGASNKIEIRLKGLGANQFLGPFLDYPMAAEVEEFKSVAALPSTRVVYQRPVDPEMVKRVAAGNSGPRAIAGAIHPPFIQAGRKHMFTADVNLPPDQLEHVWISVGSSGEALMTWNAHLRKWTYEWAAPPRATNILDADKAFVWAVSKGGIVGDSFPIPLRWMFAEPSTEKVTLQLESPWVNVRSDAKAYLNR